MGKPGIKGGRPGKRNKGMQNIVLAFLGHYSTDWGYKTSSRIWNRGGNGLHQLGQPVAPSVLLFPVFKSEGEPGKH